MKFLSPVDSGLEVGTVPVDITPDFETELDTVLCTLVVWNRDREAVWLGDHKEVCWEEVWKGD